MDLNINYGTESYIIPSPTEVVTFEGRPGKDGVLDTSILANFMTKQEALDKFALLEASIKINAEQILLTVSRTEFDLLGNQISQLKTTIDQTALSITLLATKSELNVLSGRLTLAEASLKVTADGLLLKASQSYVDALGQRITTAEASLSVQANLIAGKVSKTEFDEFGNIIGQRFSLIEQRADSISLSVQGLPTKEYVDRQVSGISTGGRNYIPNSAQIDIGANNNVFNFAAFGRPLKKGTDYVFTIESSQVLSGTITNYTVTLYDYATNAFYGEENFIVSTVKQSYKFRTNQANDLAVLVYTGVKGNSANKSLRIKNVKLEVGTIATDWTAAPEDLTAVLNTYSSRLLQLETGFALTATKTTTDLLGQKLSQAEAQLSIQADQIQTKVNVSTYNSLNQKVGNIESTVNQQAALIASKVSQTTFDTLNGRVSNAESLITQTANSIESKVSKTDYNGVTIASLINQSPTTVKIQAKNIELQGMVTASSLISGRTKINQSSNGDFEFYHDNGQLGFLMTTLNGKAIFRAFNDGGKKVFDIDTISKDGIQYVQIIADSVTPHELNRLGNYTSDDPIGSELTALRNTLKGMFTYTGENRPGYTHQVQNVTISRQFSTNAYYMVTGTYDGADAQRPLDGYHVNNDFNSPYIQDGWYTFDDRYIGTKLSPTDYGSTEAQTATAYMMAVVNGKIVTRKDIIVTL